MSTTATRDAGSRSLTNVWIESIAGACLFGIPLTYTMETWWIGQRLGPWWTFGFLIAALLACISLAYMAGHDRDEPDPVPVHARVVAGFSSTTLLAFGLLVLVGQIGPADPWRMVVSMVVVQIVPLSIGAAIAGIVFRDGASDEDKEEEEGDDDGGDDEHAVRSALLDSLVVPAAGALFMAISVAPTEEIPMIAAALDPIRVMVLALAIIAMSWVIVHASGFADEHATRGADASVSRSIALMQTLVATAVALIVAAVLLIAFGQISFTDPFNAFVTQVLVLGVPAVIGSAAGRIVL